MKTIFAILAILLCRLAQGQLVPPQSLPGGFILIVKDKSGRSSTESPLYMASNWNGWSPGDGAQRLTARSDMRWQIIVKPASADAPPLEYKITRGSWDMCEVASDLSDISNRRVERVDVTGLATGQLPTVEIEVQRFSDERPESLAKRAVDPYRAVKATGVVKRLSLTGGGVPGVFRDALVWLPPGYDDPKNAARRYPVLYMQDGQNIFEQLPGVPGEWRADEAATELINAGIIEPIMIVGIPSAGSRRIEEYLPVPGLGIARPGGADYVAFLVQEVVPRVERAFRTAPGAENRAIGGSSLGGLISLYAGFARPDVFGKVLAESPSLVLDKREVTGSLVASSGRMPGRVFLGMGGKETGDGALNEALVQAVRKLDEQLSQNLPEGQHRLTIKPDAVHNEPAWAERFPEALTFLFAVNRGR